MFHLEPPLHHPLLLEVLCPLLLELPHPSHQLPWGSRALCQPTSSNGVGLRSQPPFLQEWPGCYRVFQDQGVLRVFFEVFSGCVKGVSGYFQGGSGAFGYRLRRGFGPNWEEIFLKEVKNTRGCWLNCIRPSPYRKV